MLEPNPWRSRKKASSTSVGPPFAFRAWASRAERRGGHAWAALEGHGRSRKGGGGDQCALGGWTAAAAAALRARSVLELGDRLPSPWAPAQGKELLEEKSRKDWDGWRC